MPADSTSNLFTLASVSRDSNLQPAGTTAIYKWYK